MSKGDNLSANVPEINADVLVRLGRGLNKGDER